MYLVVGIDGSDPSDQALELVEETDERLTIVHAVDPQVYEQRESGPVLDRSEAEKRLVVEAVEETEVRGEKLLEEAESRAKRRLEGTGVEVETAMLYGDPDETIAEFAAAPDREVDGIAVGRRDLDDRYERVLGSVAKALLERAEVPVTVVR